MHNRVGAFSETEYVYGMPARAFFDDFKPSDSHEFIDVLVIGMGVCYVELAIISEHLSIFGNRQDKPRLRIFSYESDAALRSSAQRFWQSLGGLSKAQGPNKNQNKNQEKSQSRSQDCPLTEFWNGLCLWHAEKTHTSLEFFAMHTKATQWHFLPAVDWTLPVPHWDLCCFDAYSRHSNPENWEADFVGKILEQGKHNSYFSSYASTGSLKRILKTHGFDLRFRPGFGGKRECAFAVRTKGSDVSDEKRSWPSC